MPSYSLSICCPQCGCEGEANMDADNVSCSHCGKKVAEWNEATNEYRWPEAATYPCDEDLNEY